MSNTKNKLTAGQRKMMLEDMQFLGLSKTQMDGPVGIYNAKLLADRVKLILDLEGSGLDRDLLIQAANSHGNSKLHDIMRATRLLGQFKKGAR